MYSAPVLPREEDPHIGHLTGSSKEEGHFHGWLYEFVQNLM